MATMMRVPRAAWEAALRMANGIYNIVQAKEVRRSQLEQLGAAQMEFDRHKNSRVDPSEGRVADEHEAARIIGARFAHCPEARVVDAHRAAIDLLAAGWFRAAAVADKWRGPIPEVQGKKPLVLYFEDDAGRDEFLALVHALRPNMVARRV